MNNKAISHADNVILPKYIILLSSLGFFLAFWWLITIVTHLPQFILPSPQLVFFRFVDSLFNGNLLYHTMYTALEVIFGLFIGSFAAMLLGYLLAQNPTLEQFIGPYLVASQAIPTVAIAPLLVIWFGSGIISKIVICALVVFFPMLINTFVVLRSVSNELYMLMDSLKATRWQIFTLLEVPAALPILLGGLRIGATLSVIGAVVGELIGADRGLGFLINVARGQYDTALVFVIVFTLIFMALSFYGIVIFIENHLIKWRP